MAWVFGVDEGNVRRSLPIFWAVILELIASLCMREAFAALPSATLASAPAADHASTGALTPFFRNETQSGLPNIIAAPYRAMNDNVPLAAYAS